MIISAQSSESYVKKEGGGKAYNLFLLTQAGLPIPKWLTLSAKTFRNFLDQTQLGKKIETELNNIMRADPPRIKMAAEEIEKWIIDTALPKEIEDEIKKAYANLGESLISVRSSAADEDGGKHSFAGQLSSYLYITSEKEAIEAVKRCWASGFSDRGLNYRLLNNISVQGIQVGVVLQKMIHSDKSGVLFTSNPINKNPNEIIVNSVYGQGEGLVSGALDADTFILKKENGKIISSEITDKPIELRRNPSGPGLIEVKVPENIQKLPSLSHQDLNELHGIAQKIEKLYRFPQDIEWAIEKGNLYCLQSRPITTEIINSEGYLNIWDNSNIIESYGGQTLPLTFGFAHYVYHQVYVQFCEILFIPSREIRNMEFFLKNMLGIHYGRIYYNILNWYKLTSILPGFKYNRQFMETMMGTQFSLGDDIADRIKPPSSQETLKSKLLRGIAGLRFLYYHFNIQSVVDDFMNHFYQHYNEFRKINYSRLPADEIYLHYQELERTMLRQWHAPIINDYLTMVHFGLLKKLTLNWFGKEAESLQNDLLCGEGNMESAEPTKELIRLTQYINSEEKLKFLILNSEPYELLDLLRESPHQEFYQKINSYIDRFGFRCMNEMKLEEIDLFQDPSFLFVCLKNNLRAGISDPAQIELREQAIRQKAERTVEKQLSGWKKKVYLWSLKNARKAVKNRENTRFCRTRVYGIVRSMFYGMGRDFTLRGLIDKPKDIFYLTLSELYGALEGTLPVWDLKELIELRKRKYLEYADIEPDSRFLTRGLVYWRNDIHPFSGAQEKNVDTSDLPDGQLKGIPCCPGIIEAKVKVILTPQDNLDLNGEILVTMRTDPGWIPLYPAAKGLLVERGGLLSHSAIVAREMGLPTIVGINGLIKKLKTGDRIRMNGETGIIEILGSES